jgi:transcriptional regulator with XRE-family HTH domain
MKERLLKIISSEGITPSLLADELGVQRSGISHILSGRNYPSFDFMQKLLERFPKLNAEWLILGHGSMYKPAVVDLPNLFSQPAAVEKKQVSPTLPDKQPILSPVEDLQKKLPDAEPVKLPSVETKKTIEKVMVLYTDKTFVTYFPE